MRTTITVGVIARAHGVRGEVVVELRTDEPDRRFAPGAVLQTEQGRGRGGDAGRPAGPAGPVPDSLTVDRTREHQGRWLVTFAEIGDRTAAEAFRGVRLLAEVPIDERPEQPEEFYDRQLVGMSVVAAGSGEPVGTVAAVLHPPAQDLLEIDTGAGTRLVPFVTELVPDVDLEAGRVVIADLAGLLEDPADEDQR